LPESPQGLEKFLLDRFADRIDAFIDAPFAESGEISLIDYAKRMTPTYEPSRVHYALAAALESVESGAIKRLIVTFPPRHGKTELASIKFPSWYLGRHPQHAIICCSYVAKLANRISRRARNHVADPRFPFPNVTISGQRAAVEQWETNFGGEYNAAGVTGAVTGMGANILLIDDYVKNIAEADSETVRESVWDWYTDTAYPRLQPGGAVIVIATRWNEDDLIGRLLRAAADDPNSDQWTVVEFQAIAEPEPGKPDPLGREWGEPLWPERWTIAELERRKATMSSRMWNAQFQSRPVASEGNLFKRTSMRYWYPADRPAPMPVRVRLGPGREFVCDQKPMHPRLERKWQSWDASVKETETGSYCVGQVWGRVGSETYLLDQYRDRASFLTQVTAVESFAGKYRDARPLLIENKANGPAIVNTLKSRVPGMIEVEPNGDKYTRADAVTIYFDAGNVYLPHPSIAPWIEKYVDELCVFPAGANDDQVDATSQALIHGYDIGTGTGRTVSRKNDPGPRGPWDDPNDRTAQRRERRRRG